MIPFGQLFKTGDEAIKACKDAAIEQGFALNGRKNGLKIMMECEHFGDYETKEGVIGAPKKPGASIISIFGTRKKKRDGK